MFERLTIKTDICIEPENEIVYHNPNDPEGMYNILDLAECLYSGGEAEAGILMEISRRLAAYEDSGLSPEEVQKLEKSDASKEQCIIDQHGEIHRLRDELKRYKQAEQEGRLVVLYDINPSSEQAIERIAGLTRETAEKTLIGNRWDNPELRAKCTRVIIDEPADVEALEEIIKAKIDQITREIFIFENKDAYPTYEAAEKALLTCNVTKLPCAGCNPCCEHKEE